MYAWDVASNRSHELFGTAHQTTNRESTDESILGKDAFLRLLTTQLRYQDPMNPVDDQQFLAQMAQFTALEQMQNLTTTMERFIEQEQYNRLFSDATNLVGRFVEVVGASGETYQGEVDAIRIVDGMPRLVIGDTLFNVRDVVQILKESGDAAV